MTEHDPLLWRRAAVMRVSLHLVPELLAALDDEHAPLGDATGARFEKVRLLLRLPDDCIVTGVSSSIFFYYNEVAVRVAAPQFAEVGDGAALETVDAIFNAGGFERWSEGFNTCADALPVPDVVIGGD